MGKLILLFLISTSIFAFFTENYFQDDLTIRDTLSYQESATAKSVREGKSYTKFLNDPNNRVSKTFLFLRP